MLAERRLWVSGNVHVRFVEENDNLFVSSEPSNPFFFLECPITRMRRETHSTAPRLRASVLSWALMDQV